MVVRNVETINADELTKFLSAVRTAYGYDFTQYAEASLKRRIVSFMNSRNVGGVTQLTRYVLSDEQRFSEFVESLSVTVTEMFRDPEFYLCLRNTVRKRLATYPFIKVWIAGCATGEEVYSVAILLKEEGLLDRSLIYATDINQQSLHQAREGIFPEDLLRVYADNYAKAGGTKDLSDYYMAQYDAILFDRSLRRNIVFAPHNLASDESFNEFHLILCRNVLIYFNQQLQNRVMNLFYDSLRTFGVLGLGNKESLRFTDRHHHFSAIDKRQKIFMKIH